MKLNVLLFLTTPSKLPENRFYHFLSVLPKDLLENSYVFLSKLQRKSKAVIWITTGSPEIWNPYLEQFSYEYRKRVIHLETLESLETQHLHEQFAKSFLIRSSVHPLLSVFTTTFHSGNKIKRPLESLQHQTYTNWEWIIWDDSKDNETYAQLLEMAENDIRIQVYKSQEHSGFIGEMKKRASGLCKGKYLIELDHDDRIHPELLQRVVDIDQKYNEPDFIYSDYACVVENSDVEKDYGDSYGFGTGGYMYQWSEDGTKQKYFKTCISSCINPATIRHIVGVPNHVRIWKRSFYQFIQGHNSDLPVADDYELIVRTFLESNRWVRIPECMYFQYFNENNDNFTHHRNDLIQYLTGIAKLVYDKVIHQRLVNLQIKDQPVYPLYGWIQVPKFESEYFGQIDDRFVDCITIVIPVYRNTNLVEQTLHSIFQQNNDRWKVYLIGNNCPEMEHWISKETWPRKYCSRIDWWNFRFQSREIDLINYVLKIYMTNANWERKVMFLRPGMIIESDFWTNFKNQNSIQDIFGKVYEMKDFKDHLLS